MQPLSGRSARKRLELVATVTATQAEMWRRLEGVLRDQAEYVERHEAVLTRGFWGRLTWLCLGR